MTEKFENPEHALFRLPAQKDNLTETIRRKILNFIQLACKTQRQIRSIHPVRPQSIQNNN